MAYICKMGYDTEPIRETKRYEKLGEFLDDAGAKLDSCYNICDDGDTPERTNEIYHLRGVTLFINTRGRELKLKDTDLGPDTDRYSLEPETFGILATSEDRSQLESVVKGLTSKLRGLKVESKNF